MPAVSKDNTYSHRAILDALEKHDPDAAEETARGHVRHGKETIIHFLKMGVRLPE